MYYGFVNKMKVILCLISVVCCGVTVSSACPPQSPCLDASGIFPVPGDCHSFYNCAHCRAYKMQCAPGTAFDAKSKICNYPHLVDCGAQQQTSGAAHGSYGGSQTAYGNGQGGYGGSQRGYGGSQGGYAGSQGGYAGSQGGYAGSQGGYAGSQGGYSGGQGGYDGSQGGYGASQGGYGSSQGGYPGGQSGYDYGQGGGDSQPAYSRGHHARTSVPTEDLDERRQPSDTGVASRSGHRGHTIAGSAHGPTRFSPKNASDTDSYDTMPSSFDATSEPSVYPNGQSSQTSGTNYPTGSEGQTQSSQDPSSTYPNSYRPTYNYAHSGNLNQYGTRQHSNYPTQNSGYAAPQASQYSQGSSASSPQSDSYQYQNNNQPNHYRTRYDQRRFEPRPAAGQQPKPQPQGPTTYTEKSVRTNRPQAGSDDATADLVAIPAISKFDHAHMDHHPEAAKYKDTHQIVYDHPHASHHTGDESDEHDEDEGHGKQSETSTQSPYDQSRNNRGYVAPGPSNSNYRRPYQPQGPISRSGLVAPERQENDDGIIELKGPLSGYAPSYVGTPINDQRRFGDRLFVKKTNTDEIAVETTSESEKPSEKDFEEESQKSPSEPSEEDLLKIVSQNYPKVLFFENDDEAPTGESQGEAAVDSSLPMYEIIPSDKDADQNTDQRKSSTPSDSSQDSAPSKTFREYRRRRPQSGDKSQPSESDKTPEYYSPQDPNTQLSFAVPTLILTGEGDTEGQTNSPSQNNNGDTNLRVSGRTFHTEDQEESQVYPVYMSSTEKLPTAEALLSPTPATPKTDEELSKQENGFTSAFTAKEFFHLGYKFEHNPLEGLPKAESKVETGPAALPSQSH